MKSWQKMVSDFLEKNPVVTTMTGNVNYVTGSAIRTDDSKIFFNLACHLSAYGADEDGIPDGSWDEQLVLEGIIDTKKQTCNSISAIYPHDDFDFEFKNGYMSCDEIVSAPSEYCSKTQSVSVNNGFSYIDYKSVRQNAIDLANLTQKYVLTCDEHIDAFVNFVFEILTTLPDSI